jgi:hypothetical protein
MANEFQFAMARRGWAWQGKAGLGKSMGLYSQINGEVM